MADSRRERSHSAHDEAKAKIFPVLTEFDPDVQKCIVKPGGDQIFRISWLSLLCMDPWMPGWSGVEGRRRNVGGLWMYFLLFCPGTGEGR